MATHKELGRGKKGTHHDVIKRIPRQTSLLDESRGNKRADDGADAVQAVEQAEELVGAVQVPDERVPRRVGDAVAEAGERERDDEDRVRRVHGDDDVRDQVAGRRQGGDAPPPEALVDRVVQERGRRVADERREEGQRDDDVRQVVIFLELGEAESVSLSNCLPFRRESLGPVARRHDGRLIQYNPESV